jgi:hypothetical protein
VISTILCALFVVSALIRPHLFFHFHLAMLPAWPWQTVIELSHPERIGMTLVISSSHRDKCGEKKQQGNAFTHSRHFLLQK